MHCSVHQIQQWIANVPKFAEAFEQGDLMADANVANAFYQRAIGYEHEAERIFYNAREDKVVRVNTVERYPPDTSAAVTWLANRQPELWKSPQRIELGGPDGAPLAPPNIRVEVVAAAQVRTE